ncbi:uncharacterized protein LOC125855096 [Solanum stenotomum]|uniref:uncharacterized protein LOC125855096 n=1 Tax=Solanum stenotomum TaxID=172797 RepID=UPI0020D144B4|nr:uncharacterized protein LOC125855096 [Solanum stenotomum]
MAINGRLLRTSKQMGLRDNNGNQNQQQQRCYSLMNNYSLKFKCLNKGGFVGGAEKKAVATKAVGTAVVSEPIPTQNWKISDLSLVADSNVSDLILQNLKKLLEQMPQKLHHLQSSIEKGILDCRFFSLLAVAGTLIGSLLCFIEGCYLIIESYVHYFIAISHKSDLGHVVQLLIEAIDMFLLGTAMLTFGMGLYVMFVGSRNINVKGDDQLSSKKLYYFQTLPSLMGMKSVMQAKSRIGHALIMLLQVGVLEKFKNIPVVNGLDLACFAAAVFVSSICVFILSRLAVTNTKAGN